MRNIWPRFYGVIVMFVLAIYPGVFWGCASNQAAVGGRQQKPKGFFESLADQITERECNVAKFTCPYGLGPAGEPCTCTDPSGIVLNGLTVK